MIHVHVAQAKNTKTVVEESKIMLKSEQKLVFLIKNTDFYLGIDFLLL